MAMWSGSGASDSGASTGSAGSPKGLMPFFSQNVLPTPEKGAAAAAAAQDEEKLDLSVMNFNFADIEDEMKSWEGSNASGSAAPKPADTDAGAAGASSASGDYASRISSERPCDHNNWDNVRTKKGFAFLRCRTCEAQWKVTLGQLRRCKAFAVSASKCPAGAACPLTHVHAKKWTLEERIGSHGGAVMDRAVAQGYTKPDDEKPLSVAVDSSAADSSSNSPVTNVASTPSSAQGYLSMLEKANAQAAQCLMTQQLMLQQQLANSPSSLPSSGPVSPLPVKSANACLSKVFGPKMGLLLCGAMVRDVVPGSPAAMANLRGGMMITHINAIAVHSLTSTEQIVADLGRSWTQMGMVNVTVNYQ